MGGGSFSGNCELSCDCIFDCGRGGGVDGSANVRRNSIAENHVGGRQGDSLVAELTIQSIFICIALIS